MYAKRGRWRTVLHAATFCKLSFGSGVTGMSPHRRCKRHTVSTLRADLALLHGMASCAGKGERPRGASSRKVETIGALARSLTVSEWPLTDPMQFGCDAVDRRCLLAIPAFYSERLAVNSFEVLFVADMAGREGRSPGTRRGACPRTE